ncbi:MAG: DNA polymerase [Peptostreptococcaceae bacterium]
MILSLDIETKSNIDLSKSGVYAYCEDESFEILMIAYAFDDEEVQVVELINNQSLPSRVKDALLNKTITKYAFNANFERICLSKYLNTYLHPQSFRCTQALSMRLGLPYSLDGVAKALNLHTLKDKEGKNLIKYFNKHLPEDDIEKWEKFKNYCKIDCIVERNIRKKLENYNTTPLEESIYTLDQIINDRGVTVDQTLINKAINLNIYNEEILRQKLKSTTNIENIKSSNQVKNYLLNNFNLKVDSLSKDVVKEIIAVTDDTKLIEFLKLRQSLNKTSIKKYEAMQRTVTKDNTIKGLFRYYGANKTGRFAGRLVQVQNLPQTNIQNLDLARNILKEKPTKECYEILEILYENIQEVLSNLIRTTFIARENKKLIISDFSAIEARVLASLAKEKWRIDVFNSHGKIYEASAAKMFNVDIDTITKDSPLRQKGKIAELALGYQGGVNALKVMGADKMGISENELLQLVRSFRNTNLNIVNFWRNVEAMSIKAVKEKRNFYYNQLQFIYDKDYLFIKLPSDRKLAYFKPSIEIDNRYNKEILAYYSVNQTTKQFEKNYTYGGKLTENIVQALARDILVTKMLDLENNNYPIIMHVHDEVVLEVAKSTTIEEINKIMEAPISYLPNLNLKADTQISRYYKK